MLPPDTKPVNGKDASSPDIRVEDADIAVHKKEAKAKAQALRRKVLLVSLFIFMGVTTLLMLFAAFGGATYWQRLDTSKPFAQWPAFHFATPRIASRPAPTSEQGVESQKAISMEEHDARLAEDITRGLGGAFAANKASIENLNLGVSRMAQRLDSLEAQVQELQRAIAAQNDRAAAAAAQIAPLQALVAGLVSRVTALEQPHALVAQPAIPTKQIEDIVRRVLCTEAHYCGPQSSMEWRGERPHREAWVRRQGDCNPWSPVPCDIGLGDIQ